MANRLINFLKQNKDLGHPLKAEVDEKTGEATVWLYDVISDFWGINAKDFNKELMALDADIVHLRINSPGGDVYEARAIQSALAQSGKKVIVHIDGIAASAATGIALAGDEIHMSEGAWFMIHNAWTFLAGNKNELRNEADLLDKIDSSLRKDYTTRTGKSDEEVSAWMDAETWFSADEAKENGFVDNIVTNVKTADNVFDLTQYGNVPQALGNFTPPVKVETPKKEQTKEITMDGKIDEKMAVLEQRLAEAEARAKDSEAKAKASAEKMAEYEARVEDMARATFKKDVEARVGSDDAELFLACYGKLGSEEIEALIGKIEAYQDKINKLGEAKGSDVVDQPKSEYDVADVQKYATEHGISFMEANRQLHEKE
jgi:ATP-dependent Clp protease protease subunit